MLGASAIFQVQQLDMNYGMNFKLIYQLPKTVKHLLPPLLLHSASSIQIPQSTNRYSSMLPYVYVSIPKLYLATEINLHGVSDSAFFRNHFKFVFLLLSHLYLGTLGVSIEEV